ncbi:MULTISPECIES: MATE family efflux transporter [unclassified Pseudodesulfovibrio]|uniref:MATE family efflux transporter n=1 Tax=unclassified Pseudodesulfovibrio TaxID=2661612 RepID=UPI000FEBCEF7|nr:MULTISPECIES: MATE family efflux transporter [unclassified Pseudodesulfovibrio]MCJ2163722.1 MATE family efflux transporter [Pseudodesulfovibrio sp. S3-i]RWU06023.1 MATE family efflux transporter [Pseudodesulfovibrio sp. S3]
MPNNDLTARMSHAPTRTIWNLAWPQLLMTMFHVLIGMADVWVAGYINREVQASLGIITQSLFFLLVVAMAVANGSVAAISQSIGAGLEKRAKRYIGLCLILACLLGAIFLFLGLPLKNMLLSALQVPFEMRPVTQYFLTVFLLLLPSYYMLLITNAIFRARKQVFYPLYCMIIVTSLNTVLDLGLGLGWFGMPNIGYKGLAWATFGSVTAGAMFNLITLARQGLLKRESFAPWRWMKRAIPYLLKVAWPSGLMQVVWQSGYLVLYAITASLPGGAVNALAGMSIGLRIESLLFMPAMAFNMTASILVGHYLGAREPEEAKRFGFRILGIGLISITLFALVVWQFIVPWVDLFTRDAVVAVQAVNYLKWNLLAVPFTLTSMILAGALNGAGATLYNMLIMGTATWGLRLPLAYCLGHVFMNEAEGIWIAMFCSQIMQSSALLYFFTFKNWQRFAMIKKRNGQQG